MTDSDVDPNAPRGEGRYRQFDAAEMLQFLAEVDEELQALHAPPVRLVITGGASMVLRRGWCFPLGDGNVHEPRDRWAWQCSWFRHRLDG